MPGNRFALLVSTSTYEEPSLKRLRAPGQDASELAAVLKQPDIGQFKVTLLHDHQSSYVMRKIERFFGDRTSDDTLLLYFSGHGIKDDTGSLYIATRDTERNLLRSTSVPDDFLRGVMRTSRARSQVLILDVCYGGAFPRRFLAKGNDRVDAIGQLRATGTVVLTASNDMEFAYEERSVRGKPRLSVFTKALVQGLRSGEADEDGDNKVSVEDAYNYAFKQVALLRTGQTPTISSIGQEGSIYIAFVPKGTRARTTPRRIPRIPGGKNVNLSRWVRTDPSDKEFPIPVVALEASLASKGKWLTLDRKDFVHKLSRRASRSIPERRNSKDEQFPYTNLDLIDVLTKDGIASADGSTLCRATVSRLRSQQAIVAALHEGHPVIAGLKISKAFFEKEVSAFGSVRESAEVSQTLGFKTIGIFGFDADKARWLWLSPWPTWGLGGFGWMPLDQLPLDLWGEAWSIDAVCVPTKAK